MFFKLSDCVCAIIRASVCLYCTWCEELPLVWDCLGDPRRKAPPAAQCLLLSFCPLAMVFSAHVNPTACFLTHHKVMLLY